MVLMLPIVTDNGARLAAILPTGLAALARGLGADAVDTALDALDRTGDALEPATADALRALPPIRSLVLVVVDGLGHANLQARTAHARTLHRMPMRRIQTVIPSTTGAALTTITTGRLPGTHGLVGYRIRHPELGLISTLKEWHGISEPRQWQRATPLFGTAARLGARPVAIGRPAHAQGGLTEAILRGAEYHGAATIQDRFATASRLVRGEEPIAAYLYVDELDKAAHSDGWESGLWLRRLEQLDAALEDFLRTLPGDVGVIVTADHGIIDVPPHRRLMLDADPGTLHGVGEIGGEPRMRSLYLDDSVEAEEVAERFRGALGKRAWVGTREDAVAAGWFGPTSDAVAQRLGDVLIAARGQFAFTLGDDSPAALAMVGQHGSLSEEERGVPLALGGTLAGSSYASTLARVALLV